MTTSLADHLPSDLADDPVPGRGRAGRKFAWFEGVWLDAIVAAAVTAVFIQWSRDHGRLLLYPAYDDVTYIRACLVLLTHWHRSVGALFATYVNGPPHAPLLSLLGMFAYGLLGIRDWVPYAANGLLLLIVLRFFRGTLRHAPALVRWSLVILALATPLTGELVVIFRPDLFYGWILALSLVYVISRPLLPFRPVACLKAGALLGWLLLAKTSVYPQTLVLFTGTIVLRLLVDLLERGAPFVVPEIVGAWALSIGTGLLIALPHYAVGIRTLNRYIYDTVFGNRKALWQVHTSLREHALYYVTGVGGREMFGTHVFIWVPLLLVFTGATLFVAKARRLEIIAVGLVLMAAYVVPTVNLTKSAYLGVGFQSSLIATVMYLVDRWFTASKGQPSWSRWTAVGTCVLAAALSVVLFSWPAELGSRGAVAIDQRNRTISEMFAAVRTYYGPIVHPRIMLTATGEIINPDQFCYLALKEDNKIVDAEPNLFTSDPKWVMAAMDRNDFIFVSEPGTGETDDTVQNAEAQRKMLEIARARTDVREVGSFATRGAGRYFLFAKRPMLVNRFDAFYGMIATSGLSLAEGPWRQYDIPSTRAGIAPVTALKIENAAEKSVLCFDALAAVPNETIVMKLDGKDLAEVATQGDGYFHPYHVNLNLPPGVHELTMKYAAPVPIYDNTRLALFSTLRVIPEADFNESLIAGK